MNEVKDIIDELIDKATSPKNQTIEPATTKEKRKEKRKDTTARLNDAAQTGRLTINPKSAVYKNLAYLLPLMSIMDFDDSQAYEMKKLPDLPKNGIFKTYGLRYDENTKNFYVIEPGKLSNIDELSDKKESHRIAEKFQNINKEFGETMGKKEAGILLAQLLNKYYGVKDIGYNSNLNRLPFSFERDHTPSGDIKKELLFDNEKFNPDQPVPKIELPEEETEQREQSPQPGGQAPAEQQTPAEQPKEETEQPKEEKLAEVSKSSIDPQILNDFVDKQNQRLATTEAIKTEVLNTKNQLEEQRKLIEQQNEILTAKDELEKKLLSNKKILRYVEAEDTFSFNELVNSVDELLSSPGKEADDFLIASAVQSVLSKRDALEKVRDNERRKKSSQWSKAKIKDIRVEVQRDNNISPLMARTIASIS